jgi:quercetin dioxygenase-like cupin family protein
VFALLLGVAACGAPESGDVAQDLAEAAPAATTQTPPAQEQVTRRVPQFENEHVQVWKSIILPGQPLSMHRHEFGRTIIALKGGTLTVVSDAGAERDMTWETGSAYWLGADPPGELHADVNRGTEPIEVIVVQMKGN